jgi:hypothetical protein
MKKLMERFSGLVKGNWYTTGSGVWDMMQY